MTFEPETIPGEQVRSAFQRWKNLEEEKARISEDLKELFAEQKAFGHDTKAMRAAFRLKVKLDEARPEDAEHEALVDTYLAALEAPRASRAYTRENVEEFDRETGEVTDTKCSRPAVLAVSGGEPGIPSSDDGGVKMEEHANASPGRSDATSVHTSAKSEQATNSNRLLRPHCQEPTMCRSGNRDHCHHCKKSMQESAA